MKIFQKKNIIRLILPIIVVVVFLVVPEFTVAQQDLGLEGVGEAAGLGAEPITLIIARIIRAFLGLVGLAALGYIIYGGWVWMMAGGNEEKVGEAKKILLNGTIGLAIMLMSFSIAHFIVRSLVTATGGVEGGAPLGPVGGAFPGGGGFGGDTMIVKLPNSTKAGFIDEFTLYFFKNLNEPTAVNMSTVVLNQTLSISQDNENIDVDVSSEGNMVILKAKETCPENSKNKKLCFKNNSTFKITLKGGLGGIASSDGDQLNCSNTYPCTKTFTVGNVDDSIAPTGSISHIKMVSPPGTSYFDGEGVPIDTKYFGNGEASDDLELKHIKVKVQGKVLFFPIPPEAEFPPPKAQFSFPYDSTGLGVLSKQSIGIEVEDTSGNIGKGKDFIFTAVAAHCGNDKQDEDETGVDCGGVGCLACDGGSCSKDSDCSSGWCQAGKCQSKPVISGVFKGDGAPGNYITILGKGFGSVKGTVSFGSGNALKNAAVAACGTKSSWSATQIVAAVPKDATTGPITVKRPDGQFDKTNSAPGPQLKDFQVNDTKRPGLACLDPESGYFGTVIQAEGAQFGASQVEGSSITMGLTPVAPISWTQGTVVASIPSITPGKQSVFVTVGGENSNPLTLTVKEIKADQKPVITTVSPITAARGDMITISGNGFGSSQGTVFFGDKIGDFEFQCANVEKWSNSQIIVKVPQNAKVDTSTLTVERVAPTVKSKSVKFTVTAGTPSPNLCSITPNNGPSGTTVKLSGEFFGSQTGTVTFSKSSASVSSWQDSQIQSTVPLVESGDVLVFHSTHSEDNIKKSNALEFIVNDCQESGCTKSGQVCCTTGSAIGSCVEKGDVCPGVTNVNTASYEWIFSTGDIPDTPTLLNQCGDGLVPSPAPLSTRNGGTSVCLNAVVSGAFNVPVKALKYSTDIVIEKCEDDDCKKVSKVNADIEMLDLNKGFEITPKSDLDAGVAYRVTLSTSIVSEEEFDGKHIPMTKSTQCSTPVGFEGEPSSCFGFITRTDTGKCAVKKVLVTPSSFTSDQIGPVLELPTKDKPDPGSLEYQASGIGDDECVILDTKKGPWGWDISESQKKYASLQSGSAIYRTRVRALEETPPASPVNINAEFENSDKTKVKGSGLLTISLTNPKIIGFTPNCDKACVNAGVGVTFNTKMSVASLLQSIEMHTCFDETCKALKDPATPVTITPISPSDKGEGYEYVLQFHEAQNLKPSNWYRVFVKAGAGGAKSKSGAYMLDTNYGDSFSWKFRTRDESETCVVSEVSVKPLEAKVSQVGTTIEYFAQPKASPDECDPKGQKLDASYYGWNWGTADPKVATVTVKDSIESFSWCTQSCMLAGSKPLPAVCGDGVISPVYEECDPGKFKANDGCSDSCLREGVVSTDQGGTCGNADSEAGAPDYISANQNVWVDKDKGEECDDGNNKDGDGCSFNCLNEGSLKAGSVCGNGDIGPGEDCDDGNSISGDGCSGQCLHEGSIKLLKECADLTKNSSSALKAFCAGSYAYAACGNGITEPGEACDDGNAKAGDGCSANCLIEKKEILSVSLTCGDGVVDKGEECDPALSGESDSKTDPLQTVLAVGEGLVENGLQKTRVKAQVLEESSKGVFDKAGVFGEGDFSLQCGFTSDAECNSIAKVDLLTHGLASNSCCSLRPKVVDAYPTDNKVCLNTVLFIDVDQEIDKETLEGNVSLAHADCTGIQDTFSIPKQALNESWWSKIVHFVNEIFASIMGKDANALTFCESNVKGKFALAEVTLSEATKDTPQKKGTRIFFTQAEPLKANLPYAIVIKGGNGGIKGANGVALAEGFHWFDTFRTKDELCELASVSIDKEKLLLTSSQQKETLKAQALDKDEKEIVGIEGVYEWEWTWKKSQEDPVDTIKDEQGELSRLLKVQAQGKNGKAIETAKATVTVDILGGTKGSFTEASSEIEVFICENPWPTEKIPFADSEKVDNRLKKIFAQESQGSFLAGGKDSAIFTNFATRYCRDQGASNNKSDDLPNLNPVVVGNPPNPVTTVKEFFFRVGESKDVIGIKVEKNFDHLPIGEWYLDRGFQGSPSPTIIDGFPALQDGRTLYISGMNPATAGSGLVIEALRTNVYVISYNQGASPSTLSIYNQFVNNFTLMFNLRVDGGFCYYDRDVPAFLKGQKIDKEPLVDPLIECNSDFDCSGIESKSGGTVRCSLQKPKALRDLARVSDLGFISSKLEEYYAKQNSYPSLTSGTFIPAQSVSVWKSWQSTFANNLGTALPVDPLNQVVCEDADAEQSSCWNQEKQTYACSNGSRVYEYLSVAGGKSYLLGAEFELPAYLWKDNVIDNVHWNLGNFCFGGTVSASTVTVCGNGLVEGNETCDPPGITKQDEGVFDKDKGEVTFTTYQCSDVCQWKKIGAVGKFSCGDGNIQLGESCDDGDKNGQYGFCAKDCSTIVTCGDGVLQSFPSGPEVCETSSGTKYGLKKQDSCNWDCREFGPYCGDGKIYPGDKDGKNKEECDVPGGGAVTQPCTLPDGSPGVQTGGCGLDCTFVKDPSKAVCKKPKPGEPGADEIPPGCGDGTLDVSAGEECDLGDGNGVLCSAEYNKQCTYCNKQCQLKTISGPFCGDGSANGIEECDNLDFTAGDPKKLCTDLGYQYGAPICNVQCTGYEPEIQGSLEGCQYCGALKKPSDADEVFDVLGQAVYATQPLGSLELAKDVQVTLLYNGNPANIPKGGIDPNITTPDSGTFTFDLVEHKECAQYSVRFSKSGMVDDIGPTFSSLGSTQWTQGHMFFEDELADGIYGIVVAWAGSATDIDMKLDVFDGEFDVGKNQDVKVDLDKKSGNGACPWDDSIHSCIYSDFVQAYLDRVDDEKYGYETMRILRPSNGYNIEGGGSSLYRITFINNSSKKEIATNSDPILVKVFTENGLEKLYRLPGDEIPLSAYSSGGTFYLNLLSSADGNSLVLP